MITVYGENNAASALSLSTATFSIYILVYCEMSATYMYRAMKASSAIWLHSERGNPPYKVYIRKPFLFVLKNEADIFTMEINNEIQ